MATFPIKRTVGRKPTILLRSANIDSGPYYLTDITGYGVSWRVPTRDRSGRRTWAATYTLAALAFELCDLDETLTPKMAKAAVDTVAKDVIWTEMSHAQHVSNAFSWLDRKRKR